MAAGGRGRIYTMEQRSAVLSTLSQEGLAAAHKKHGVPKSTISKWAKEENIPTATPEKSAQVQAATEASRQSREIRVAESRSRMTLLLATISELAARAEIDMIRSKKATLSELVGARTRALHDLNLLEGKATERSESINVDDAEIARLQEELRHRQGRPA